MIIDEFIFNGILYALAIFGGLSLLSIIVVSAYMLGTQDGFRVGKQKGINEIYDTQLKTELQAWRNHFYGGQNGEEPIN